jgi:hypothetical protein
MGKPLQQDENGNIINDTVTQENQKGYANYEADLKKQQDQIDQKSKDRSTSLMKAGLDMLSRPIVKKAKGGMIGSASKRADGCAVKGKTRGKMV